MAHERDKNIVEEAKNHLATALNRLETCTDRLEYLFERNPDWHSGVQWQIEEAVAKLGFALATLTNWWEDEEEEETKKEENK